MPVTHGNEFRGPEREGGARFGLVKARYDFATHGGAVGDIALGAYVPSGALITGGLIDVITPATSGGAATVAVKTEGAGDILAATAVASVTGKLDIVPDHTGSTAVKTTAEREVKVTIATAALTAGKFDVYLTYVMP